MEINFFPGMYIFGVLLFFRQAGIEIDAAKMGCIHTQRLKACNPNASSLLVDEFQPSDIRFIAVIVRICSSPLRMVPIFQV